MYSQEGGDSKNSLKTLDSDLSIGRTWPDWFNEASFTRLISAPTKKGLSAYCARSACGVSQIHGWELRPQNVRG